MGYVESGSATLLITENDALAVLLKFGEDWTSGNFSNEQVMHTIKSLAMSL